MRRMHALAVGLGIFVAAVYSVSAQAQQANCRIGSFSGASSPQGAVVNVTMRNHGRPCVIPTYGLPAEKANPAESGRITTAPTNGVAAFVPPAATYLPKQGFVGIDEFQYEAWARGQTNAPLRLLVTVKIQVDR